MSTDRASIVMLIVSAALMLDSITLTMVVPIIPDLLLKEDNEDYSRAANTSNSGNVMARWNGPVHYPLVDADSENTRVGLLLSSKAIVQLILNPFVGQWTNAAGYALPLFFGSCILLLSNVLFAAGDTYLTLFIARASQGVASACIGVTGMCLLADTFGCEPRRSRAMGVALGSAACGVLIGYPFGGFFYDLFGKTPPFIIIALLVFLLLVTQFYCHAADTKGKEEEDTQWNGLVSDSRVLLCVGTIGVSTSAMAILEPCLPIWLLGHIKPKKWQLGTAFIPDSMGYALGTNIFSQIAYREGRLRVAIAAMILVAMSCIIIPLASSMVELVLPHFLLGLGIGAVDAALVPLLASLADAKKAGSYGTVYTVQQTAVCLAYAIGPMVGGALVRTIGFPWLMTGVGILNLTYCLLIARLEFSASAPSIPLLQDGGVFYRHNSGNYQRFEDEQYPPPLR